MYACWACVCRVNRHPLFLSLIMATNVRSIQQKLFRSESQSLQSTSDPPKLDSPLSISIPKTVTPPPSLPSKAGKPKESKASPASNGNAAGSYRDRIRQKLGSDYKTVEEYRLDQDNKRERHWKRWGPYVSDRQWVCHLLSRLFDLTKLTLCLFIIFPGNRQGRLLWRRRCLGTFPP
jgi:hypothetical protein